MTSITDIRKKYPQYDDVPDAQLLRGLHKKFYSDMDFADFAGKIEGANLGAENVRPQVRPEQAPEPRGWGQRIYENVIGSGEVDTPGERLGQTIGGVVESAGRGFARGTANLLDIPGNVISGANDIAASGLERIGAIGPEFGQGMRSGSQLPNARQSMTDLSGGAINEKGDTTAERIAGLAGEFAPGALGAAGPRGLLSYALAPAAASEVAGQATEGSRFPDQIPLVGGMNVEPVARLAAEVTAGGLAGAADDAARVGANRSAYIKNSPSADALRNKAGQLYEQAGQRGVVAAPGRVKLLRSQVRNIAKKEGFITPKGNVTKTAPELRAFLDSLDDYVDDAASVTDLQALRAQLQVVAESQTPKVSRIGVKMLKAHDNFVDHLAPELKQANALYTRAKRGDMMDQVDELADIRASNFSQSGRENALRTEFRMLDRNVAKGKVKGLRPDQARAVSDVSRGTPATNVARTVGKAAPTGVVSAAGAGGVPFMIGNAMGGPAVGSAMAAATMGTGMAGRGIATHLQERAAQYASAAMRAGVPIDEIQRRLGGGIMAIMATEAAARSQEPQSAAQ